MTKWIYERDGGFYGPVTHYITNMEDRVDFDSKREALLGLKAQNRLDETATITFDKD